MVSKMISEFSSALCSISKVLTSSSLFHTCAQLSNPSAAYVFPELDSERFHIAVDSHDLSPKLLIAILTRISTGQPPPSLRTNQNSQNLMHIVESCISL